MLGTIGMRLRCGRHLVLRNPRTVKAEGDAHGQQDAGDGSRREILGIQNHQFAFLPVGIEDKTQEPAIILGTSILPRDEESLAREAPIAVLVCLPVVLDEVVLVVSGEVDRHGIAESSLSAGQGIVDAGKFRVGVIDDILSTRS